MESNGINNEVESIPLIQEAVEIAHNLINELYQLNPKNSTFEQVGLVDGKDIVLDYIELYDYSCALEHLLYMIHESDIKFPRDIMLNLHKTAKNWNLVNYYCKENQINLSKDELSMIYNAP
jgi:hypothetical protein